MARTTGTTDRLLERLQHGDAVVSEEHHHQMTPGTELVVLLCTDVVGPDEEIRWIGNRTRNTNGRHDTQLGMIFLDVVQFRTINDRFGYPAADAVLTEVAHRLEAGVRKADIVARVGDNEFLILLPDVTDLGNVVTVSHRMEQEMLSPITFRETEIFIQTDMGTALYPDHGSSLEQPVRTADRAISGRRAGPSQAM